MFFAKDEAQTRLVFRPPQEIVHSGQIKVHFASEFRLEFFDLKIDHDVAAQSQMIEKQIEKEVLVTDFEVILPSNEREAFPKLQHEIANVFDQTSFQIPLLHVRSEGEEIKIIRVLYQLLGKIRLRGRESFIKVGQCMPLSIKQVGFNLVDQDIPTPAALDRLPNVPLSPLGIFYAVQNPDLVTPRQLCNNLLHKLLVRVRLSQMRAYISSSWLEIHAFPGMPWPGPPTGDQ